MPDAFEKPKRGGRPTIQTPQLVAHVVDSLANGASVRVAGRNAGVSKDTAHRIGKTFAERVKAVRERITLYWGQKVLLRRETLVDAACETMGNIESRQQAQMWRTFGEYVGAVGRQGPLVAIDQRSVTVNVTGGAVRLPLSERRELLDTMMAETADLTQKAAVSSTSADDNADPAPDPGYDLGSPPDPI